MSEPSRGAQLRTPSATIDSEQRAVLFRLLAERFAGANLLHVLLAAGRAGQAERFAVALQQDLRVMGAIGWQVDDPREMFPIRVELGELLATVTRLAEGAERSLARVERKYGRDNADAASASRDARVLQKLILSLHGAGDT